MDVYDTLNPDAEGIDAIGCPANGDTGFKDADDDGAVHRIDAQSHHIEAEAHTGVSRSGNGLQIDIPRQGDEGAGAHHPKRRDRTLDQRRNVGKQADNPVREQSEDCQQRQHGYRTE